MTAPVSITRNDHPTFLKWHRARRTSSDPVFTGRRIIEGMAAGASVEVDLVVTGDDGFAVLHNIELEEETTGTGRVDEITDTELRQLHLRGNDGAPIEDRVMLLDDLCQLIARNPLPQSALLQLDYKLDMSVLTDAAIANFARATRPISQNMIVSGGDANAIETLTDAVPGMRAGYDPSESFRAEFLNDPAQLLAFTTSAISAMPKADMIYLYWEIVTASAEAGFDMVGAFHKAGKRIDAWTIQKTDQQAIRTVNHLLDLKIDQITTDDPQGLFAALQTAREI